MHSHCHPAGTSLNTDMTLIILIVSVAAGFTLIILIVAAVSKYTNDTIPFYRRLFHSHIKINERIWKYNIYFPCCFDVVWHRRHKKKIPGTVIETGVDIHPDVELEYIRGLVGLGNACFAIRYLQSNTLF